jgi:hypothetical protein
VFFLEVFELGLRQREQLLPFADLALHEVARARGARDLEAARGFVQELHHAIGDRRGAHRVAIFEGRNEQPIFEQGETHVRVQLVQAFLDARRAVDVHQAEFVEDLFAHAAAL